MKKLIVLAVAAMFATSAFAGDLNWNGSTGVRYSGATYDDQLNSTTTVGAGGGAVNTSKQTMRDHAIRANLGATGGSGNVEYGTAIRTGTTANTDYVNYNNAGGLTIGLSEAWFKYSHDFGMVDVSAIFGRQKNVFVFDASQQLFDNDVNFDGFGWNFKMGSFGLNAAQYILGAHTANGTVGASNYTKTDATEALVSGTRKMSVLYGFQPYMNWKFADEISAMFALGFYNWTNYDSATNRIHGGYNSSTLNTSAATGTVPVHNPKQWQFYTAWDLPFNLGVNAEYIMNKKTQYLQSAGNTFSVQQSGNEADRNAYSVGINYGKVKKAHDWSVGYAYGSKGIASVINTFSNDKFLADNKGHTVMAKYALADNFNLGFKGLWLKEKANKDDVGVGVTTAQSQKTTYWEVTAGVAF